MAFAMNEVTSKVAYAYAKQSASALLGIVLVVGGSATLFLALSPVPPDLARAVLAAADAYVIAVGALIVALVAIRKNLEKVNRPAVRAAASALGIVALACLAAVALRAPAPAIAAQSGGAFTLLVGVVGYPLPIRRGSAVLYDPAAVRELANARTLGVASFLLVSAAASRLLLHAYVPVELAGPFPVLTITIAWGALGLAGVAMFLLGLPPAQKVRALSSVFVLALLAAFLVLADAPGAPVAWAIAAPEIALSAGALGIAWGWSHRLNRGKVIVAHRA